MAFCCAHRRGYMAMCVRVCVMLFCFCRCCVCVCCCHHCGGALEIMFAFFLIPFQRVSGWPASARIAAAAATTAAVAALLSICCSVCTRAFRTLTIPNVCWCVIKPGFGAHESRIHKHRHTHNRYRKVQRLARLSLGRMLACARACARH